VRHDKPARIGETDVEQDRVRPQVEGRLHGRTAVGGLAEHDEAGALEESPDLGPEARMVVDDEDRGHRPMLPCGGVPAYGVSPTTAAWAPADWGQP
jgi:hypothetical protein